MLLFQQNASKHKNIKTKNNNPLEAQMLMSFSTFHFNFQVKLQFVEMWMREDVYRSRDFLCDSMKWQSIFSDKKSEWERTTDRLTSVEWNVKCHSIRRVQLCHTLF